MAGMATKQGLDMQVNVFVDDFAGFHAVDSVDLG